jgi:hypothetical protein
MSGRFILSVAHNKTDIQTTAEKFDSSLKELEAEGALKEFT